MSGPYTSPVCQATPFLSEPERSNGFTSKNAQDAIEEALALAVSNDRFLVLCLYGGQANSGRFLEFFLSIDSNEAPLHINALSKVNSLICSTTGVSSNATIGFYDKVADPTYLTPLYVLDMTGLKTKEEINQLGLFTIPAGGELAVKVDSSSIQKPHIQITLSTAIA